VQRVDPGHIPRRYAPACADRAGGGTTPRRGEGWQSSPPPLRRMPCGIGPARRRVVGRTLVWISRCRRLSKDCEQNTKSSEAMIHIAMIGIMVRTLAR
jgi:hypothetical protein